MIHFKIVRYYVSFRLIGQTVFIFANVKSQNIEVLLTKLSMTTERPSWPPTRGLMREELASPARTVWQESESGPGTNSPGEFRPRHERTLDALKII